MNERGAPLIMWLLYIRSKRSFLECKNSNTHFRCEQEIAVFCNLEYLCGTILKKADYYYFVRERE